MGCSGVMHQREKHTKSPTFSLDIFRGISKLRQETRKKLLRVRKRKINLYKRNVIKVRSEKLRFHKEGNVMNEIYLYDIKDKALGNIMICAANMPTREAELIRSLNVLREMKYYQLHVNNLKLRK